MNRTIKFRAWDKQNNKMLEVGNPFEARYTIDDDGIHYGELVTFGFDLDKYVFMQFTGLLDKNGTPIYEGDVVHFNTLSGNNMYYEVRWSDAKTGFKPARLTKTNQAEIKVIGNIYENKDLLK